MAKLYPPIIENCIMFKNSIEVPFQHNMSVYDDGNLGYALRIKTISTNKEIVNVKNGFVSNKKIFFSLESYKNKLQYGEYYKIQVAYIRDGIVGYYSSFALARCTDKIASYSFYKDNLIPNKFHLSVSRGTSDRDDILYTYRVWLCKLKISNDFKIQESLSYDGTQANFLNQAKSNSFNSKYDIVGDTNTQLVGSSQDDISFSFKDIDFDLSKKYYYFLIGKITTVNGLVLKTAPTLIPLVIDENDLSSSNLYISKNFEYGYIFIRNDGNEAGYLSKKSEKGYQPIKKLAAKTSTSIGGYYYDFCVEQGQIYTYILGKDKYILNDLDLSKADVITKSGSGAARNIRADYEDMSLWDGKYILRLKYNPQVSSFKTSRSEQKVETLGSQFPFVFYNSKVGYKEFPISAFIATEMDNNNYINSRKLMTIKNFNKRRETTASDDKIIYGHGKINGEDTIYTKSGETLFSTEADQNSLELWSNNKTPKNTTDDIQLVSGVSQGPLYSVKGNDIKQNNVLLTLPTLEDSFIDVTEEFKEERLFKNKVMDWLNNGQPKLFRSPQEGMFIVQIMGVSMSPNDQLARKMHTVSMNAVEIAEYNYENLIKYNLISDTIGKTSKGELIYSDFTDYSSYSSLNAFE